MHVQSWTCTHTLLVILEVTQADNDQATLKDAVMNVIRHPELTVEIVFGQLSTHHCITSPVIGFTYTYIQLLKCHKDAYSVS